MTGESEAVAQVPRAILHSRHLPPHVPLPVIRIPQIYQHHRLLSIGQQFPERLPIMYKSNVKVIQHGLLPVHIRAIRRP